MVVVRSMQLTQKKTTATFKQLDGVIRATKPDGSKTSYTHKCGELDKTVPIMIGPDQCLVAFTPSTRLASIRRGRGWSHFLF